MPVLGVRPQIIKSAPIINLLDKDEEIELQLIHSGQHYDYEMSKLFFDKLNLPDPLYNLEIRGGSHAIQTAKLIERVEEKISKLRPDIVMVFGDANTTLGAALAAIKAHVGVCHVEAGLRSYDISMAEEVNRVLTDHCSQMLCAPTLQAKKNLEKEGIKKILLSGDTMYDMLLEHREVIENSTLVKDMELANDTYAVLTLHRSENVDNPQKLKKVLSAIKELRELKTIFPVHPRTEKMIRCAGIESILKSSSNMVSIPPLQYFDMLKLMKESAVILTDSGGMQKEALLLGVPCITLRYVTEWVETVELRANTLVGVETERIIKEVRKVLQDKTIRKRLQSLPNPYGDGKASHKIVKELKQRFNAGDFSIKASWELPIKAQRRVV